MRAVSRAFCPAGISSFFEICDQTADGTPIEDPEKMGARGGGFVIKRGVETRVDIVEAARNSIRVIINGKLAPEAKTTRSVAETLLTIAHEKYHVTISHVVAVPIGAGFGSSAGGATGTAIALADALKLRLTYNELGRIAHVSEIRCKTGLGTVGPVMLGGCILTIEPGSPGIGIIDRLPLPPDLAIVAGTFEPIPTKKLFLSSPAKRSKINRFGNNTLKAILEEPSVESFLAKCLEFANKSGFMTERTRKLVKAAERAGAVGATQNMVGEAVHALTRLKNMDDVAEAFKQVLPEERVITTGIDFQGARLL